MGIVAGCVVQYRDAQHYAETDARSPHKKISECTLSEGM